MKKEDRIKRVSPFARTYLWVLLAMMYLPILILIIYSFNANKISSVWGGFSMSWYRELFRDRQIGKGLVNTLILGVSSSLCAAFIGTLGAIGTSRSDFKGKGIMEYIANLPMMIPEIIMGMVFLAFFSILNLHFGMLTLMIAHTAFCIPYIYMQVKARIVGMDKSLEEAARDLGATKTQAFKDITLPLIMPAIISGMLLAFAMSIDDVIISVFVTGVRVNTLPIIIYSMIKTGVSPKVNALCSIMFVLTFTVVIVSFLMGKKRNKFTK